MTAANVDDVHSSQSREEVAKSVRKYVTATELADGRVISHVYLTMASVENLGAEIGWTLHPDVFDRGHLSEAAPGTGAEARLRPHRLGP